ncbi:hypothetical protein Gotur_026145 [Gossypium turneri]
MSGPPSPLIENYLREAGFWHVANIGRGCKLDPKLICELIERWRLKTHTFHLSCGECTITLEDVQLQLRLPVDGSVFTGSVQSADWGAICHDLLGAIMDNIYKVERIRYARAYILEMIRSYLMPNLSRNLVHLKWLLKFIDFRVADKLSWGLPITTTIIGSVLLFIFTSSSEPPIYIHTHNEFQWTPYEDPIIRAVIPDEFFQN